MGSWDNPAFPWVGARAAITWWRGELVVALASSQVVGLSRGEAPQLGPCL